MPTISKRAIYTRARSATTAAVNTGAAAIYVPPTPTPAPTPCCCPACTGLQCLDRTRFFAGQLLTEADLNNDQAYWLAKSRLHNRYLFGWGVVCGMQVVCSPCEGWVTIKPGYAIDPCGNDIIVCGEQSFDVLKAIQGCCTPVKPPDCAPLRSAPPPNCKDAVQKWCVTIQYEEQPTRTVTPLKQTSTKSGCGCGCGGGSSNGGSSKGGCGCGGGGKQITNGASACCCSSAPMRASTTPGCEPTRTLEGFKLGVCPAPPNTPSDPASTTKLGTRTFPGSECIQAGEKLILQRPSFNGVTDPNAAYTLACNYLTTIRRYLATASFTSCQGVDGLNNTAIPKPDQNQGYIAQVQAIVDSMVQSLQNLLWDCFCFALLPTCPPDPCTNCLILACVTVQNGEIIDICHFGGGRRQVVTFPALGYWLSLFGMDKLLTTLTNFLQEFCCEKGESSSLLQSAFLPQQNLAATGFTNPAMFQQLLAATLAQNFGANILNASNSVKTFDLRPLVGLSIDEVSQTLKRNQIQTNVVEASTAWTDSVVAQGADFAPSAFPTGQPLTVYTRKKLVVGFEPTSATDLLRLQVAELQRQVQALQSANETASKRPRKE